MVVVEEAHALEGWKASAHVSKQVDAINVHPRLEGWRGKTDGMSMRRRLSSLLGWWHGCSTDHVHCARRVFGNSSPTVANAKDSTDGIPSALKQLPSIHGTLQGDAPCTGLVSIPLFHPRVTYDIHPWTWRGICMDESCCVQILVLFPHPAHPSVVRARLPMCATTDPLPRRRRNC